MKLKLSTYQRVMCNVIVGGMNGDVRTIRKAMKALDALEFKKDERERIGLQQTPDGYVWNPHEEKWEIEINDEEAALTLKNAVASYSKWPAQFAREVIDLAEQLGIGDES